MNADKRLIIAGFVAIAGILGYSAFRNNQINLPDGPISTIDSSSLKDLDSNQSELPKDIRPQVEIKTSKGSFVVELRPDLAPKTVANYLALWSQKTCEGRTFHRVENWVIQGCDPKGDGTGGEDSLPTEISSESFVEGSLGVARKPFPKEKSNNSQFFVITKDATGLDSEYTYFGKVISGIDVVKKIQKNEVILETNILTK